LRLTPLPLKGAPPAARQSRIRGGRWMRKQSAVPGSAILTRIKQSPPDAAADGPSHSSLRDIHTGDRASLYKVNRAAPGRRLES